MFSRPESTNNLHHHHRLIGLLLLVCLAHNCIITDAANILGLFTAYGPSHLIVHMSVAGALAERGHNVTVVCSQPPKVTHDRINVIIIPPREDQKQTLNEQMTIFASRNNNVITTILKLFGSMRLLIDMQVEILQNERFTQLTNNPDTHFDLVIVGYFMNEYQLGVAAHFKCPVIVSWSGIPVNMITEFVGNPTEVAYVPDMSVVLKPNERMGFVKRLQNMLTELTFKVLGLYVDFYMEKFYNQIFPVESDNFPSYYEMKKNVSLLFCNSHFSESPIRANVPALIEIGGIQIKPEPDPLPKDIADFLDNATEDGAVLFCLGSVLQGSNIRPETVSIIFETLSSLPQKIIWKWENLERTPGNASNILYKQWVPQSDILAHQNLRLFLTHAGKGGISEAQYHGVPIVALPVFADQYSNAERMVLSGYGLKLDILDLRVEDLRNAIREVIESPVYSNNIRKFSQTYQDRPLTARQSVVFWTEYVIRHHGAQHMQSARVHLNFVERNNLDVLISLFLILYIVVLLIKSGLKFIYWKVFKQTTKVNIDKVKEQ